MASGVDAARSVKDAARDAIESKPISWLARLGLVSRGLIWLTVGLLAARIATGAGGRARADRQGALRAIADKPFGHVLLLVLVVGFCGYAAWRLLEAVAGHRDDDGMKRTAKRLGSLGRALLYGAFGISTIRFLASSGRGSKDNTEPLTARVMSHTGGRWLVGVAGMVVLGSGLVIAVRAVRAKFLDKLVSVHGATETVAKVVGRIGLIGRGLVIALIGWFVLHAAWTFDAKAAKGMDQSLKSLVAHSYGEVLLLAAAVGLVSFGLWSFIEARYREIES